MDNKKSSAYKNWKNRQKCCPDYYFSLAVYRKNLQENKNSSMKGVKERKKGISYAQLLLEGKWYTEKISWKNNHQQVKIME